MHLKDTHIIVTAGPTHEPIDPVRYLTNRSSGKQGFAIAAALAARGARITLIAGPVTLPTPQGVTRIDVQTAREMAAAVGASLPADAAVMVAAVADWRVAVSNRKIKKDANGPPVLNFVENPDILADLARGPMRPRLLIGFAAETEDVLKNAKAKLARKGCDWIVANNVSGDVMGGAANTVHVVTADGVESWERSPKEDVAERLAARIESALVGPDAPYHAHIYFSDADRPAAFALRDRFAALASADVASRVLFTGAPTSGKTGPHPVDQYEIHFLKRTRPAVEAAIRASGLRALIHPLTNDDLGDHTRLGEWIGAPLDLDLSVLDPPGENRGIARFARSDF